MNVLTEAAAPTMATFLTEMTSGLTTILSGVTAVCTTIVSTPFLLFTTIFLFAGGVVGIIGRILSRG